MSEKPLLHSVREAAQLLGIGRTLLYELTRSGRVRPVKVGGRTLFTHEELERFVREQSAAQPPGHHPHTRGGQLTRRLE
jgi:excisionase family DNA binding protein